MKPVTLKLVSELDGSIKGLELWQDNRYITVSLINEEASTAKAGYKWFELRESIDNLIKELKND